MKKQVLIASAIVLCSFAIGSVEGVAQQIFNQFRQPQLVTGLPYKDLDLCTAANPTTIPPQDFTLPPTNVNDLDDGYAYIAFPAGVVYNYNGTLYSGVYVSINGFLTFDNTKRVAAKNPIGLFINSSSYPDNAVAPFWGDHRFRTSADISLGFMPSKISWAYDYDRDENCQIIQPARRCIIVQWKNLNVNTAPVAVNSSVANFQARLYIGGATNNNQGEVEFAYGQVGGNPYTTNTTVVTRGATVGIKGNGGFPGFLSDFWNGLVWQPQSGANQRTDSTSIWQPSGGRSDARIRFSSIVYLTFSDWGYGDADTSGAQGQRHFDLPQNRRVTANDARVIMRSIVTKKPLDSIWKRQQYLADVNHSGRYYYTKLKRDFSGDSIVGGNVVIWRRTIDVEQFFPGQGVGPNTNRQVVRVMFEGDGLYGVGGKAPDVSSLNQIYYEASEYDAGLIMRYISGRLPYLPWIYDNDTTGPDFGKTTLDNTADDVRIGTPTSIGGGLVQVPVFLNNSHDGAFGVRFTTNSDIVSVVPVANEKNVVTSDFGSDIAVVVGNGSFDQNQPVAIVTMKENNIVSFSDVRFNERPVGNHSVSMVENTDANVSVYPNPVSNNMTLTVNTPNSGHLTVRVYDSFGKLVSTIFDANTGAGVVNTTWNTADVNGTLVAAGTYVIRMEGAGLSASKIVNVVR
ncbi:MAG: T9SS type A sorting domain-containing protein [Candidatus Kapabacteria bacterium]|nr:T9SS type A sorting domain-containing protein [Candidatus Kapabacteria bacterium]